MKTLATGQNRLSLSGSPKRESSSWSLREKLTLGLSCRQYFRLVFSCKLNWLLSVLLTVGLVLLAQRYLYGLGAVSHSSNNYPWGLFLGFGLFGMVPLSASGFLLGTTVVIFGRKDFHGIERLALLNGLLGYFFAVVYLLVDLGMPWRLTFPMFVSFGPAAVLFLVAWHVATYLSVQFAELMPAFFEWFEKPALKKPFERAALGLTIAGIILSTLHQGALGALFCYAPNKLHPLWISIEYQWIHFLCSAVYAGISMVIVTSTIISRCAAWRCGSMFMENLEENTLGLAKGASFAMITYLVIKLMAIAHDNEWEYLLTGWGGYYIAELTLGVVLPLLFFARGVRVSSPAMVRIAAIICVFGILWNRLNTTLVCFNYKLAQEIPCWQEIWLTVSLFAVYFVVYRFIVYRLPIVFQWRESEIYKQPV